MYNIENLIYFLLTGQGHGQQFVVQQYDDLLTWPKMMFCHVTAIKKGKILRVKVNIVGDKLKYIVVDALIWYLYTTPSQQNDFLSSKCNNI